VKGAGPQRGIPARAFASNYDWTTRLRLILSPTKSIVSLHAAGMMAHHEPIQFETSLRGHAPKGPLSRTFHTAVSRYSLGPIPFSSTSCLLIEMARKTFNRHSREPAESFLCLTQVSTPVCTKLSFPPRLFAAVCAERADSTFSEKHGGGGKLPVIR
jgi:hypothetical protein